MHTTHRLAQTAVRLLALAAMAAALPLVPPAHGATTITWANAALVSSSSVSSTASSASITVPSGTWAVGDVINFTGTTNTTNPFGTTVTRYYVVSVAGSTLQVSTTPGGSALSATNTTSASTINQGVDWPTTSNWTGGIAPNSSSSIASFANNSNASTNAPIVVNAGITVYGLTASGTNNGDVVLVGGASGTGLNALTFATDDSSTPKISLTSGSNSLIALGTSGNGSMALKIAGTQGLIFNSSAGGALTGSGTSATSTAPGKAIRSTNVDWSGLSGGIQVERGIFQLQAATGVLPNQTLTVGNAQTTTNNLLAGVNLSTFGSSVDALNGTSLGRIYGASTLTVGSANGTGDFGGVIGKDFTGATTATNLAKAGTGTQTLSGIMAGTGTVTVNTNGGTLVLSGANSYTGATTVNSGGTLKLGNASALGSTASTTINSGGTLDLGGQTLSNVISITGSGVSSAGALINSNTGTAAVLNSEIVNGASFTAGGAGDMTVQRARSGGSIMTLTKVGAGALTLGNASTTAHMNLLAVDVTSASTVNFNTVSGTNYLVADRGVRIGAGGTVKYTGTGTNMGGDNQAVSVSNGTFNMHGISDTVGRVTIGDGTNSGVFSGGSSSTLTVGGSYQAFAAGGSSLTGGIEAMSGSVNVKLAGAAALTKTTSGTVTLSLANSYSGATTVNAGTLLVNGSIASAATVNAGIFGGSGSSSAAITLGTGVGSGATFAPGNAAIGTFTTTGAVSMLGDATLAIEFNSTLASFDKLIAAGLSLSGTTLSLTDLGATTMGLGQSFTIVDNTSGGSVTGTFLGQSEGSLITVGANTFAISYVGGTGNDIVLTTTAVPETSTYAALAGLAGLVFAAYRRRRA